DPAARDAIEQRAAERKRVLLLARAGGPLTEPAADEAPTLPPLTPIALAVLSERMRRDAATTVGFLLREGVDRKGISGDGPTTVAAVATAAGIDTAGRVTTGPELPDDDEGLRQAADHHRVFARIAPEQKKRLVEALAASGRRIAMVGDGVNDVPALKRSDVAPALRSRTP